MNGIRLRVEGVGFWGDGIAGWEAARGFVADGTLAEAVPRRPSPQLLAPNERRRAPDTVALALAVAQEACAAAGRDPAELASVFASTHGELAITDHLCEALADDPLTVSPIRFHNSVHNAAAGYWTIGTGCRQPATALSAGEATFVQGLIESAAQVADEGRPVLLAAYDIPARGPLAQVARSRGMLGAALVLAPAQPGDAATLALSLDRDGTPSAGGPLAARYADNAMAPMLPLFEAMLAGTGRVVLASGRFGFLRIEVGA